MKSTCHAVKRTDSTADTTTGKVNVNRGGMQGFMSQKSLNGKQIHPVFIQMGTKSVTEGVAGKPAFPSQPVLMCMDMP